MDAQEILAKKDFIKNIVKDKHDKKIGTGYLFFCKDSKTNEIVLEYICKILMCENDCCDICSSCLKIKNHGHPDVVIYPKGASLSVLDSKDIIEQANKKPMLESFKIIVINNFDISSAEAQNKLLKTLEEPPQNVVFLCSATNLNNVLATIKSRLTKIEVPPFDHFELEHIFEEYKNKQEYELAIQNSEGYIGKAREILDEPDYLDLYHFCKRIVVELKSSAKVVEFIGKKLDKKSLSLILENLQNMYRDVIMLKTNQQNLVKNKNFLNQFDSVKDEYSILALTKIIKNINEANKKQFSNVSPNLILETLLIENLEVKFLCK